MGKGEERGYKYVIINKDDKGQIQFNISMALVIKKNQN